MGYWTPTGIEPKEYDDDDVDDGLFSPVRDSNICQILTVPDVLIL